MRAARIGCIFTFGFVPIAVATRPSSLLALSSCARSLPFTKIVPGPNFFPPDSNASSAACISASFISYRSDARAGSAWFSIAKIVPSPFMSSGARNSMILSIGAFSMFPSVTRVTCTPNSSPNVHPVSSYGVFCGSSGLQYWWSSNASAILEYG